MSPLIIDSSSFELIYQVFTVTVWGPRLALSFSRRLTSSASDTRFLSMPFLAALMMEFSMPIAFSGLTVLIFITEWNGIYTAPWPRELVFELKSLASALRLIWIDRLILLLGLFSHLFLVGARIHQC